LFVAAPDGAATPLPTISSVTPYQPTAVSDSASASTLGRYPITVIGANFAGATAVDFRGTAASSFTIVSDTEITTETPTVTNVVGNTFDVTVTTPNGTSGTSMADEVTYPYNYTGAGGVAESSIRISASSDEEPVNGTVILTATASADVDLSPDFGLSIVDVTNASEPVAVAHTDSGAIVSTPAISEAADEGRRYVAEFDSCSTAPNSLCPPNVVLPGEMDGGVSTPFTVTWGPWVGSVGPSTGSTAGGTTVTINGGNFTGATAVDFGVGNPATNVNVVDDNTITATTHWL